jgi:hypothetical protein
MNVNPLTLDVRRTYRLPQSLVDALARIRRDGETESEQVRRILVAAVIEEATDE